MASIDEQLAMARQRIMDSFGGLRSFTQDDPSFAGVRGFFDQAPAQALLGQLQGRASGADAPFTPQILSGILGQNTGAINQGFQNQQNIINRGFANAGLSGSGLQMSALVDARRAAASAARAARAQITSRAQLSNFQARERAQQQVQGFLQQQLQNQQFMAQQQAALTSQATAGETGFLGSLTASESGPGVQQQQQPRQQPQFANNFPERQNQMTMGNNRGGLSGNVRRSALGSIFIA